MVIRQAAALVGSGVGLGLVAALASTRILVSLLVGIPSYDPPTYVMVSVLVIAAALLACYVPALRAMRADPMTALRYE